jgi:hypothetical protein
MVAKKHHHRSTQNIHSFISTKVRNRTSIILYFIMEIKKETREQRIGRQAGNAWISGLSVLEKSELNAKMKIKRDQLKGFKRSFGEKYMDMIDSGSSARELAQCVKEALREMQVTKDDIVELKKAAARIDEKTKNKIQKKPEVRQGRPAWLFPV